MRNDALRALAALSLAITSACGLKIEGATTSAAPSFDRCDLCHGDETRSESNVLLQAAPPVSVSGKSPGAHFTHLHASAVLGPIACAECHVVPTSMKHANGQMDFSFGPRARMGGAQPSFAGRTCSNVYCHGATLNAGGTRTMPTWDDKADVGCADCHGNPPPAHQPGSENCYACHSGTVNADNTINVAMGAHINGKIEDDKGGVHPDGWVDPAQHGRAANKGLAGCQTCHGTDFGGGTSGSSCNACHAKDGYADWTTNCTFCHGARTVGYTAASLNKAAPPEGTQGETAITDRAVGAHEKHLTGGNLGRALACTDCHASLPTDLGHIDGKTDLQFDTAAAGAWTGTTCTNYCHGATLKGGSNTAPQWTGGPSQTSCGTCHGVPPPAPHPAGTDCGGCHAGYTATAVNLATHLNGKVEADSLSCTSCHGDATRSANTTNPQLSAAPPAGTKGETATSARAVGAHQKHLVGGTISRAMACAECHAVPTAMDHKNGKVDLTWGTLARSGGAAPTWTGTTCTNYCHGSTLGAGGTNTAPTWTGSSAQAACGTCHGAPPPAPHSTSTDCGACHTGYTATSVNLATHLNGKLDAESLSCTSCHGDGARAATAANPLLASAPPTGTNGETATSARAVGAHQKHLTGGSIARAIACTECHAVPTSNAHENGTVDMSWGALARTGNASPTWNGTTCTNYCHGMKSTGGSNTAPTWTGGASQASCGTCHGNPPPAPHSSSPTCGGCHPGYTNASVNLATHLNGKVEASLNCGSCHGVPPASGAKSHHSSKAPNCGSCHSGYSKTSVNSSLHENNSKDVGGAGTRISSWNAGSRTCTTSCHEPERW